MGDATPADRKVSNMSKTLQTKSRMKELNIATFNVRGLTKGFKKVNLVTDLERYKVDLCCLQETKIKNGCDINKKKHRIICFPTKNEHYGMGFLIHKKWKKFVHKAQTVNDRIAVLQMKADQKQMRKPKVIRREGLKMTIKTFKNKVYDR